MPSSESRHTAYALIFHLNRRVRLAHQALAYEIDAVRDVARRRHHGHFGLVDQLTSNSGGMDGIVALSYTVLGKGRDVKKNPMMGKG